MIPILYRYLVRQVPKAGICVSPDELLRKIDAAQAAKAAAAKADEATEEAKA